MTDPNDRVCLERIIDDLPEGFDLLRAEKRRMMERLGGEWLSGTTRFNRAREALMGARLEGILAGIGGLTREPSLSDATRMRRFSVGREFRRHGIGRTLALTLLEVACPTTHCVTVDADAGSAPVWEGLGFLAAMRVGHTHVLHLADRPHQHR